MSGEINKGTGKELGDCNCSGGFQKEKGLDTRSYNWTNGDLRIGARPVGVGRLGVEGHGRV